MSKIIENLTSSKKRGRGSTSAASKSRANNAKPTDKIKISKPAQAGQFDPASIKGESTVIYLGHIPPAFGEAESRKFFAQFGKVRRVKIFKSMKTGGSKGYGFVQFETHDVAVVVAEAMDGYLLSDRQLVCHVIPVNKLHEGMFLPPKQVKKASDSTDATEKKEGEEEEEESEEDAPSQKKIARLTRTQSKKQKKLKDLGIDYEF